MQHVILLGHKARTGKDTVADYLFNQYGFFRYGLADKLKQVVADLYAFDEEQMYGKFKDVEDLRYPGFTPRQILQKFGQEQKEVISNFWAKYLFASIDLGGRDCNYVVPDCRFPDEIQTALDWERINPKERRVTTVKIVRDNAAEISGADHISETALGEYKHWNFVILNNTTVADLYKRVDEMVTKIFSNEQIPRKETYAPRFNIADEIKRTNVSE